MAGKNVVVTGANGFFASNLIKNLLERGYNVRGTVRNPDDVSKVGFLLALPGAKERLTLYKADLVTKGCFDTVVDGVDGVFHTASPVFPFPKDPQTDLIDPAVNGTLNLLEAAEKSKTVKRVILTSSVVAMIFNTKPRSATTTVDESWWSDPEFCREKGIWYPLSKTLAERAAWEFVKGKHFQLITICPGAVLGTMLQPSINGSNEIPRNYLSGDTKNVPNLVLAFVDVEDCSLFHILAYEKPEAEGRYFLAESAAHSRELAELLRKVYPQYPVTTKLAYERSQEQITWTPNTEKAEKLGVKFTPLETQLARAVKSMQEKGFLSV